MRFQLPFRLQHLDERGDDGIAFAHLDRLVIGLERQQRGLLVVPRPVFAKDLLARVLLVGIRAAGISIGGFTLLRKDDRPSCVNFGQFRLQRPALRVGQRIKFSEVVP